jgi:hypothetical protein
MKSSMILLALIVLATAPSPGQAKAVHFKKLQEFLPTIDLPGFERKKPTGQTQTSMGMTTSEAKVRYATKQSEEAVADEMAEPQKSIEITITDMSGVPFGQMAAMAYQQDFENESEDGYEKSVVVKKNYKRKESAHTGDYKSCELEFAVGNRFLIKLQASNTDDVKLLHSLANSMDLAKLEKTAP